MEHKTDTTVVKSRDEIFLYARESAKSPILKVILHAGASKKLYKLYRSHRGIVALQSH